MLRSFFLLVFFASVFPAYTQDIEKKVSDGPGISLGANYSFSGLSAIVNFEWQNRDHIFYTGPKFLLTRSYLPFRGPFGWNLGYRHDYNKSDQKKMSFFFNVDYQIQMSKSYSYNEESNKMNHVHELFVGYGVQYRFSERLYLANAFGVGAHLESYYNVDLDLRRQYWGYNNLFKFFLNYKF